MNNYEQTKAKLEQLKCKKCDGGGVLIDLQPGDIGFKTFKCTSCNGTGLTNPPGKTRRPKKPGFSLR